MRKWIEKNEEDEKKHNDWYNNIVDVCKVKIDASILRNVITNHGIAYMLNTVRSTCYVSCK